MTDNPFGGAMNEDGGFDLQAMLEQAQADAGPDRRGPGGAGCHHRRGRLPGG